MLSTQLSAVPVDSAQLSYPDGLHAGVNSLHTTISFARST